MLDFLRRAWARTDASATLDWAVVTAFAATIAVAIFTTVTLGTRTEGANARRTHDAAQHLSAQRPALLCPPRAPRSASEEAAARC